MFLKIKKDRGIKMNHNGMDKKLVVDITSNFLINMAHIGEISFYSQHEPRQRVNLAGNSFTQPAGTLVIHLQMAHTYASMTGESREGVNRVREKVYYKLYFAPENIDSYQELRDSIEARVVNL
ncbi:MAG: Uncharacterised protein [Marinobacterium sp. xm-d-530]|jgi:hypothetical protein|nr:MAG: Uncharacterised protein [Marinobacterium sp. xm-d-530]